MKKITQEEFEERIKLRFPKEDFTVLKYKSIGKNAIIKCNTCGEILSPSTASNFLINSKAYGCVNCHGLWREREKKLKEIKKYYNILETYVQNTHTYYKVKCKKCGHIRESSLKNLFKHLQCGCETGVYRNRTPEEFIQQVNLAQKDEYELISKYEKQQQKILIKHKKCGFIYKAWAHDLIAGKASCPKCKDINFSKGAKLVKELLDKNNIQYEIEKTLKNSRLRFDFYIEKNNKKIAIEYNGEQHYKENNFFSTSLKEQQERDNRKVQYCYENNIELIVIPYTLKKEKIEDIIIQIKNKLNDYPAREQGF